MAGREGETPQFHAVLTAQRSLGARGLAWAGGLLAALAAGTTVLFLELGAWPIAGFTGAELGLAALFLVLHHRAGRAREELLLDDAGLTVVRIDRRGRRSEVTLQPAWLRVSRCPAHGSSAGHVQLASHGRTHAIGAFLTEGEQAELAEALRQALARWRAPAFQ